MSARVDHVVVGHGLVGATLALALRARGQDVLVVDRGDRDSASRIAAGLITPVTGKRFAVSPRWPALREAAMAHYDACADVAGRRFVERCGALRFLRSEEERARFEGRREILGELVAAAPEVARWRAAHGSFAMPSAARLDTEAYLDWHASTLGPRLLRAELDAASIESCASGLRLPELEIETRRVSFCRGIADADNPYFPELCFEPAKGEILDLELPSAHRETLHFEGRWLVALDGERARLGASYDREDRLQEATSAARAELEAKLRGACACEDYAVVGHRAAIRPIVSSRQPVIGVSRRDPRVGILNGFGSKGALYAPSVVSQYVAALEDPARIDPDFDVHKVVRRNGA